MTLEAWADFTEQLSAGNAGDRPREEHPAVVLGDLEGRRRPRGHIITFANEKGGVGKSTLAFHCAVALVHRGLKVIAVDCDRRQQSLHRLFDARDGTARTLKVDVPRPLHFVLDKADNLPTGCMGDGLRIRQILVNLLSNAISMASIFFCI